MIAWKEYHFIVVNDEFNHWIFLLLLTILSTLKIITIFVSIFIVLIFLNSTFKINIFHLLFSVGFHSIVLEVLFEISGLIAISFSLV
jgi:hypothetical protein